MTQTEQHHDPHRPSDSSRSPDTGDTGDGGKPKPGKGLGARPTKIRSSGGGGDTQGGGGSKTGLGPKPKKRADRTPEDHGDVGDWGKKPNQGLGAMPKPRKQ